MHIYFVKIIELTIGILFLNKTKYIEIYRKTIENLRKKNLTYFSLNYNYYDK